MTSASEFQYPAPEPQLLKTQTSPYVEVVEQPAPNTLRFRYECERRSAGCIYGVNSSAEVKTYPSIKVHGYKGPAAILISCVTKDDPPKPHPHSVMVKNATKNGVYSFKAHLDNDVVTFKNLSIQCIKKKQVKDALAIRKYNQVDPFMTGFDHMDFPDTIDLNALRLCFQVFILGRDKKFSLALNSVVTNPIYDKKAIEKPEICKLSHNSASVAGGMQVILLCGKVSKDDIQIRFFEMRDNTLFWDAYGDFSPQDVHKQVAINFKTPRYCDQDITEPVNVHIQLIKKSDGTTSKAVPFTMLPTDVSSLKRKRMKVLHEPKSYVLEYIQKQAEKQGTISNQGLLVNFMNPNLEASRNPFAGDCVPRPSPIFQDQGSMRPVNYDDQASQKNMGFNIPFNQQYPESEDRSQPRTQIPEPISRIFTQAEILSQRPRLVALRAEPLRRMEPPPPNVTMNTHAYREPVLNLYGDQETKQYPMHSYNPEPKIEMERDDPFKLNDLDLLSTQDLADVLGPTNSDYISETLSENLSKELSISDQIQDTLQHIEELNKDVAACQQYCEVNLSKNSSYNLFPSQTCDNYMDQGRPEL